MSFNLNLKFALKKLRFYLSINHVHQSEKAALNPHKNLRISRLIPGFLILGSYLTNLVGNHMHKKIIIYLHYIDNRVSSRFTLFLII